MVCVSKAHWLRRRLIELALVKGTHMAVWAEWPAVIHQHAVSGNCLITKMLESSRQDRSCQVPTGLPREPLSSAVTVMLVVVSTAMHHRNFGSGGGKGPG